MSEKDYLDNKSITIIFIYAYAGLGHLRVTDALNEGLSKKASHTILGVENKTLTYFHRLTSVYPAARFIFERVQRGVLEDLFTFFYRRHIRKKTGPFSNQVIKVLKRKKGVKKALIIATHYELAHKLGQAKKEIEKKTGMKVILILQVTDDSPQQIWYVSEADIIFVPSHYTRKALLKYAINAGFRITKMEVLPYPVSPRLSLHLSEENYQNKIDQIKPDGRANIHILVPISGAAVGMDYFLKLILNLHKLSDRFKIHFIVKRSIYTQFFLSRLKRRDYVRVHDFQTDRGVIDKYESEYQNRVISIEITKPSEQAFKSLLNPTQVGGSILLFTRHVGRQEKENLMFMKKHFLIPEDSLQEHLWKEAEKNRALKAKILKEAGSWRGLRLPNNPYKAAEFINWCLKKGIFLEMMKFRKPKKQPRMDEVNSQGVKLFWSKIEEFLGELS